MLEVPTDIYEASGNSLKLVMARFTDPETVAVLPLKVTENVFLFAPLPPGPRIVSVASPLTRLLMPSVPEVGPMTTSLLPLEGALKLNPVEVSWKLLNVTEADEPGEENRPTVAVTVPAFAVKAGVFVAS